MIATQVLSYLDIKATASGWAAEYDLYEDDIWHHPYSNVPMTITQVLWSLYTERYMSLEGMKRHFDRYANTIEQKRQFEAGAACDDVDTATMPVDMVMYWRERSCSSWYEPADPAPIWEFCDEEEAPTSMSFVDSDGLVIVEVGA